MPAPQLELTHRQEFSASHRLHDPRLSDEENRALYGPCNNLHGHGHNYEYEVTVKGPVPASGMILDLNVLMVIMREEIFERVDHRHLNHDVPFLEGVITTAENIAIAFWEQLAPRLAQHEGFRLHRVRVSESHGSYVDYYGPNS
jgi:6-pyruvoyltetrahydropterin/6-carboxytetrahydropterin synthase